MAAAAAAAVVVVVMVVIIVMAVHVVRMYSSQPCLVGCAAAPTGRVPLLQQLYLHQWVSYTRELTAQ